MWWNRSLEANQTKKYQAIVCSLIQHCVWSYLLLLSTANNDQALVGFVSKGSIPMSQERSNAKHWEIDNKMWSNESIQCFACWDNGKTWEDPHRPGCQSAKQHEGICIEILQGLLSRCNGVTGLKSSVHLSWLTQRVTFWLHESVPEKGATMC